MDGKTVAMIALGIGLFFLLIGAILYSVTSFMDLDTKDDVEDAIAVGGVASLLFALGSIIMTAGFAYAGANEKDGSGKIGWFIFASVSLYALIRVAGSVISTLAAFA